MTDEQVIIDDFNENDKVEQESEMNLWKYKETSEIVGIVEQVEDGNFNGKKIFLKTNLSEELILLPELDVLNSKLKDVEVGNKLKIVYLGDEKSKKSGRMYATFDVFIK